ncbi:MAG TPA: ABC transporter permease [Actinomycetota bacterium]|nr:ABC transporter permease [Actinomycetota bacterium]
MTQSAAGTAQEAPYDVAGGHEPEHGAAVVARTPWQLFWQRFREDKLALAGGVTIVIMVLLALTAPVFEHLTGHPFAQQYRDRYDAFGIPLGPDSEFWFGSDDLGRDLFVRVLYGARVSLKIALLATGFEVIIGVLVGLLSGYAGGKTDTVLSRLMDLVLSIPFLLLGISLAVSVGASQGLVIFIIVSSDGPTSRGSCAARCCR